MILVTGAAGKTGKAIITALAARNHKVRALVHRNEQIDAARLAGAEEFIVGDFSETAVLKSAVTGIRTVYHICPNVNSKEVEYGRNIIEAARSVRIERFIFHSVLHPQIQSMPHHWAKMRVEELIFESGLPFTIVQPAAYMQNILAYWNEINAGVLPLLYAADRPMSMVDLMDVAEAVAIIVEDPRHEGAIYELAGPDRHTQAELAAALGDELGIKVQVDRISIDLWKRDAESKGLGQYQIDALARMFDYYDRYGFYGNSMVLSWILGRESTSFSAFLRRFLATNL